MTARTPIMEVITANPLRPSGAVPASVQEKVAQVYTPATAVALRVARQKKFDEEIREHHKTTFPILVVYPNTSRRTWTVRFPLTLRMYALSFTQKDCLPTFDASSITSFLWDRRTSALLRDQVREFLSFFLVRVSQLTYSKYHKARVVRLQPLDTTTRTGLTIFGPAFISPVSIFFPGRGASQ